MAFLKPTVKVVSTENKPVQETDFFDKNDEVSDADLTEDQQSSSTNNKAVYFYCSPSPDLAKNPLENTDYQHCIVSLAEGLTKLGYTCYGNIDYWQSEVDGLFLIREAQYTTISKVEAIIISSHWWIRNNQLPITSSYIPLVLMADMQTECHRILQDHQLSVFHLVLLAGYMSCYKYPANVYPWAFGLSNRIINETTTESLPFNERTQKILFNFRMEHTSRSLAQEHLVPSLSKLFEIDNQTNTHDNQTPYEKFMEFQTGKRHYTQYYKRLQQIKALAAFAGYFSVASSTKQFSLINRIFFAAVRMLKIPTQVLVQHDSWRFWEGLAAGALTFHINFDQCKVKYPQQPIPGFHYIGLPPKLFSSHSESEFFAEISTDNFEMIANQGRKFALSHYAPVPVAKRFLELLYSI